MQLQGLRGFSPFDSRTACVFDCDPVDWLDSGDSGAGGTAFCCGTRDAAAVLLTIGDDTESETAVAELVDSDVDSTGTAVADTNAVDVFCREK